MKQVWLGWCCAPFVLLTAAAGVAGNDRSVPIQIINYSKLSVHATAVALEEQLFPGPVRVRRADNSAAIPLARGVEDGRAVLRLFVSLPPSSRLDLVAEPAEQWTESQRVEAKSEFLRNGAVRVDFGKRGWRFGFDAEKAALLEDGQLDFGVDNQNRGRIMNSDPKDLGLAHFATAARVDKRAASAIWDDTGKTTDTFQRFVVPLIRATIQHNLIPTKEDVLRNVKLAVFNDNELAGDTEYPHRDAAIVVSATQRPSVEVTPGIAMKSLSWDEERNALALQLSCAGGAVEVYLNSSPK